MAKANRRAYVAHIVEEGEELSLAQVCAGCNVSVEWVVDLVREGGLAPRGRDPRRWRFAASTVARINRARRLHRDLGLNAAGLAVTLDLLDEIDRLRRRIARLEGGG